MRHRWVRVGLASAFLTAAVLALLAVPAAAAAQTAFWDQKEHWSDQTARKALRATRQAGRWEVLVDLENDGKWDSQGFLKEVYRRHLEAPVTLDEALKSTIASFETDILIAEVRSAKGNRLYVVAVVFEQDPAQGPEGSALKTFLPLYVNEVYQDALQFAQTYEGGFGHGEFLDSPSGKPAPPEEKLLPCAGCGIEQRRNNAYCNSSYTSCLSAADSFLTSCYAGCIGITATACQAGCASIWFIRRSTCAQDLGDCLLRSQLIYDMCIINCPDGGGGECSVATDTTTTALSLDRPTGVAQKLMSSPIKFALARSETRGEESFIMDEWAFVKDGRVRTSSNPAFARAVTDQRSVPDQGSFLMIQEPVHPMNSRHVPKPEVRISSTALARSERGTGEIVAARIELSPTRTVDRVEIVYTSRPMEESRLKELVSQRVGLVFATEKGHRTTVYLSFRLTDRIELLDTVAVFPKCCCGGVYCV